jgi:CHAT domain-containing protein
MRDRVIFLLSILTMLFAQAIVHAQSQRSFNQSEAEEAFNTAASKYGRAYRRLGQSRGVDLSPRVTILSHHNIANALSRFYPEQTAMLFYDYDEPVLRVWLVNSEGIQAYRRALIPLDALETAASDLRKALNVDAQQALRAPRPRRQPITPARRIMLRLRPTITRLSAMLLPENVSRQLAPVKHLVIVPALGLGAVPFAVMQPVGTRQYLIDRMSISIAPSLFDVVEEVEPSPSQFQHPLVVGNPLLPENGEWFFPPLPGAQEEAQLVADAFKTTPFIGASATKAAVLMKAPNADILYFATHAVASGTDPLHGSFLALSADKDPQGRWTAQEIQTSRFRARLAVLSACQTGLGKTHDAGVIGLARAFQIAGVPRVVMSLWSVNDAATAELMQAFVANLRSHVPAEALRRATLQVRRKRPHPAQWASFVLFGTPR